jgi:hypothetical protein
MCLRLLKNIGDNFPKYNSGKKNKLDACSLTLHIVIRGACVWELWHEIKASVLYTMALSFM